MIRLDEVALKIENILNGSDADVIHLGIETPTGFYFKVETEGFHINSIADKKEGKNFIPVFISSMGGQFNPVPDLLQANYVIPIALYFPVRFKNEAFKLNEYLARVFVGRQLNYGKNSGKALSNISVARYGEIVDLDLQQFQKWVKTTYLQTVEIMEPYLQVTFELYLSTVSDDFVYGNDVETSLSVTINGETYTESNLALVENSIQSHSEPAAQQLLGSSIPETEGYPVNTSYSSGFAVYIKNNDFFRKIIERWFEGNIQKTSFELNISFLGSTFTRQCYCQSVNLVARKGELATITFAFIKRI